MTGDRLTVTRPHLAFPCPTKPIRAPVTEWQTGRQRFSVTDGDAAVLVAAARFPAGNPASPRSCRGVALSTTQRYLTSRFANNL
jgi:hypothetical protein